MNPIRFMFALFAFLAVVMVTPVWMYYVWDYGTDLPMEAQWIAGFTLPALALFLLAGWFEGGTGT